MDLHVIYCVYICWYLVRKCLKVNVHLSQNKSVCVCVCVCGTCWKGLLLLVMVIVVVLLMLLCGHICGDQYTSVYGCCGCVRCERFGLYHTTFMFVSPITLSHTHTHNYFSLGLITFIVLLFCPFRITCDPNTRHQVCLCLCAHCFCPRFALISSAFLRSSAYKNRDWFPICSVHKFVSESFNFHKFIHSAHYTHTCKQ